MNTNLNDSECINAWLHPWFDEHGKQVRRTPASHPYNYDGFVQERCGANSEANGTVWTDHLLQWDYARTRALLKKHFKDTGIDVGGDYWGKRSAEAIQGFLRERLDQPELRVILVMEYCNQSSGYPTWRIDYHLPPRPHVSSEARHEPPIPSEVLHE
jgi:hypothetical protein